MSNKRQAKQQKRERRKHAKELSDSRRQRRLALPLSTQEGYAAQRTVDEFISTFRTHKDVDRVDEIFPLIDQLNLLRLHDHRYGIAQAIVSIYRMFPDLQRGWMHSHRNVLSPALHLIPDEEDDIEITCDLDIDRRMVHWMVTGDESAALDVHDLAKEGEPYAARAFRWYLDRHEDLYDLIDDTQATPYSRPKPIPAVQSAEELCSKVPKASISFVVQQEGGWVVGVRKAEDVEAIRSTLPSTHAGLPVDVRLAMPSELTLLEEIEDEIETPL